MIGGWSGGTERCGRRAGPRQALRWASLAALALGISAAVSADVPTRYEQFIYSVIAFNGRDYSGTFVRQPSETLYLIANRDSFLQARETFVYYWPITGDYRLDTATLDHQFDGKLNVTGNGISRTLSMERYTYYNLRGEYELNWKVAKGAAAETAYSEYRNLVTAYEQKMLAYRQAQIAYRQKLNDLAKRIGKVRKRGGDVSKLVGELKDLKQPKAPVLLSVYAAPPISPQQAFVLDLPAGTYRIELINPDGTIMEGSRKRLVVFSRRGEEKVGYDVIPADKWTRPEASELPGSVLYVNGTTDLYLRPYYEAQYNELYHKKLVTNDARGNPNMAQWVKLGQVPNAKVVLADGEKRVVGQEPFGVRQIPGASLGYKIIPWSQLQHQPGAKPDLIAYHVSIRPVERLIRVSSLDEKGKPLAGGERQIRVISGGSPRFVLLVLVLLPLAVAGFVMGMRARRYSG